MSPLTTPPRLLPVAFALLFVGAVLVALLVAM